MLRIVEPFKSNSVEQSENVAREQVLYGVHNS
jgi:hypothetical protein